MHFHQILYRLSITLSTENGHFRIRLFLVQVEGIVKLRHAIFFNTPSFMSIIAGIDEAGRGALAGPVTAGACVIAVPLFRRRKSFTCWSPFERKRDEDVLIADSKALSPEERERTYEWIIKNCAYGAGSIAAEEIDSRGILAATNEAMLLALAALRSKTDVTELLIDGRDKFRFPLPHRSIIRGDATEPTIAAGSIVAKVTRDRYMREVASQFPHFGFEGHKGYGSELHITTIKSRGPCALHRKSFLRSILETQALPFEVA
jgi:ribonuclease HII